MLGDRYTPHSPGIQRLLRLLSASFRIGRFFGVEVRIYWIALVVMPAIMLYELWLPGLGLGTIFGLSAAFTIGLFAIIYSHEMSHIAAGWRYGIRTPLITLSPMGGVAHMGAPAPWPGAEAVIALAGPAVHLLWLAAVAPLYFLSDSIFSRETWQLAWFVEYLWSLNLALMVFNLLPFYPMDGGRVLRALLSRRMNPNRATVIAARVGQVGAVLLGLYGLYEGRLWGFILIAIGITNFQACMRAVVAARYQQSPYGGQADYQAPWEQDPDAWKQGGDVASLPRPKSAPAPKGPGPMSRWLQDRRERKEKELEQELDRILIKIKEVGMDGLTAAERKTLDEASKVAREKKNRDG